MKYKIDNKIMWSYPDVLFFVHYLTDTRAGGCGGGGGRRNAFPIL